MPNNHPLQIAGWAEVKLNDICELISRGKAPQYVSRSIIRVIGQRCVREIGFQGKDARFQDHKRVSGHLFARAGDVLLNSTGTGTIGRSCLFNADSDYIVDGHVAIVRPYQDVCNSSLLNSFFKSPWLQQYLEIYCYTGSTNQIELSAAAVGNIKLSLPTATEQRAIATILESVDEAIRQTEAVIAKLRQVKAGMLHDLLTCGLDENGELRDPIRDPEQFKNSSLGRIPREWEVVNIGMLANFQNGHCFNSKEWRRSGLPIIRIQNLNENVDFNYYQGPVRDDWHILPGDLLFAWAGQKGSSFGPRIWRGPEAVLNQHIFKVLPKPDLISKSFLNILLGTNLTRIEDCAHGFKQSFLHIPKCDLISVKVSLPRRKEQSLIEKILLLHESQIEQNLAYLSKLIKAKHGLMHDLLTGKVRVPKNLLEATP